MSLPSPSFRYRCERFKTNYIKYPCAHNMDRIADLIEKNNENWGNSGSTTYLGPLEHCAMCRGNELIELDDSPLPPSDTIEAAQENIPDDLVNILTIIKNQEKRGKPVSRLELSLVLDIKHYKIDLYIKELLTRGKIEKVSKSFPNTFVIKKGVGRQIVAQAPLHPKIAAQKDGHQGGDRPTLPENPPGENQSHPIMTISATTNEEKKINTPPECEKQAQNIPELFLSCNNHPGVPAKIDQLGRSMGLCNECVAERGRQVGKTRIQTTPIPLNHPKYAPLKIWLEEDADINERSLSQEIMYCLKKYMQEQTHADKISQKD